MSRPQTSPPGPATTLGILAGGRGSRLGGRNKALLRRDDGSLLVESLRSRFAPAPMQVLLSVNRDLDTLRASGFDVVVDRHPALGPLGALDALAAACTDPWLMTVPADAHALPDDLLARLHDALPPSSSSPGVSLTDADGPQPLVALWRTAALRVAASAAIAAGELAVHILQARMAMAVLRLADTRIGNLNTARDLDEAGIHG